MTSASLRKRRTKRRRKTFSCDNLKLKKTQNRIERSCSASSSSSSSSSSRVRYHYDRARSGALRSVNRGQGLTPTASSEGRVAENLTFFSDNLARWNSDCSCWSSEDYSPTLSPYNNGTRYGHYYDMAEKRPLLVIEAPTNRQKECFWIVAKAILLIVQLVVLAVLFGLIISIVTIRACSEGKKSGASSASSHNNDGSSGNAMTLVNVDQANEEAGFTDIDPIIQRVVATMAAGDKPTQAETGHLTEFCNADQRKCRLQFANSALTSLVSDVHFQAFYEQYHLFWSEFLDTLLKTAHHVPAPYEVIELPLVKRFQAISLKGKIVGVLGSNPTGPSDSGLNTKQQWMLGVLEMGLRELEMEVFDAVFRSYDLGFDIDRVPDRTENGDNENTPPGLLT